MDTPTDICSVILPDSLKNLQGVKNRLILGFVREGHIFATSERDCNTSVGLDDFAYNGQMVHKTDDTFNQVEGMGAVFYLCR